MKRTLKRSNETKYNGTPKKKLWNDVFGNKNAWWYTSGISKYSRDKSRELSKNQNPKSQRTIKIKIEAIQQSMFYVRWFYGISSLSLQRQNDNNEEMIQRNGNKKYSLVRFKRTAAANKKNTRKYEYKKKANNRQIGLQ